MRTTITSGIRKLLLVVLMTTIASVTPKVKAQNNFVTGIAGPSMDQAATYSQPSDNIVNMLIYPRPTHDIVTVQAQVNIASNVKMTVIDMLGRTLLERTELLPVGPLNYKVDLSRFANGMYILEIRTGDQVISTRLIKD